MGLVGATTPALLSKGLLCSMTPKAVPEYDSNDPEGRRPA